MTFFGGMMTLIGGSILGGYMIMRIAQIYFWHEHEFTQINYTHTVD